MSEHATRVLVTGAAGGIGRAVCFELLADAKRNGRKLVIALTGRLEPAIARLASELRDAGATAHAFTADLSNPEDCRRIGSESVAACEGLDLFVSVAGAIHAGPLDSLDATAWDRTFNVNVRATWLVAQAVRHALAESRGAIIAIASMAGLYPFPGLGAYSPSKAALIMLCRQLAQEWAGDGIRVNTISPGLIRTPLTESVYADPELERKRTAFVPLQRIGLPEDIARAVVGLAGSAMSYATGIDLRMDGGVCDRLLGTVPGRPQ
jgi:glucose 1-dehydrogenase